MGRFPSNFMFERSKRPARSWLLTLLFQWKILSTGFWKRLPRACQTCLWVRVLAGGFLQHEHVQPNLRQIIRGHYPYNCDIMNLQ